MTLGQQITALRKKKKLSQAELGKRVDTLGDIIGRYERDEIKPSIEAVIRLADAWKFRSIIWKERRIWNWILLP